MIVVNRKEVALFYSSGEIVLRSQEHAVGAQGEDVSTNQENSKGGEKNITPYACKSATFIMKNTKSEEIAYSLATHVPLAHGHAIDVIEMQVGKNTPQVLAVYNHVTNDCCFIGKHLYRIRTSGIFSKPWYGALSVLVFALAYMVISAFTFLNPLYFSVGIAFVFFLLCWGGAILYAPYIDHKLRIAVEADIIARYGVPVNTIYYYM